MVGVQGVGGIPEPQPERPANLRDRRRAEESAAPSQDGVQISSEAQAAANVARIIAQSRTEPEIRADRVAEARASLERGEYKHPDVVAVVAERLSKFLR